ncbi:MAG: hypothetical protein C5B52_14880 [Bacteroidetes bacterium]|nr:MAG: hypothetical protein C5B52_14880 [Bacteroidota bacterium]
MPGKTHSAKISKKSPGKNSGSSLLMVNEPAPEYALPGFQKIDLIRAGVSKTALENFKKKSKLDYETLAKLFSVTRATLINKKGKAKFSNAVSEKIINLADLYSFGYNVFENIEKFNAWMEAPNRALGGQPPLEMADTNYGIQEIKNLVGRIEQGVYS